MRVRARPPASATRTNQLLGLLLARTTHRYCAHVQLDGRPTPRENISISASLLLLKIAARTWATQTEESPPSPWGWWPHITRGRIHHRSGCAKRLLGYGCTAARPPHDDPLLSRPRRHGGQVKGGTGGRAIPNHSRQERCGNSCHWEGREAPLACCRSPSFRERKIPTTGAACGGLAWLACVGRSSPRSERIWARTLVPCCQPSPLQIRGPSCPIAHSRRHKKTPSCKTWHRHWSSGLTQGSGMYANPDRNGDHQIVPFEDIIGAHLCPV